MYKRIILIFRTILNAFLYPRGSLIRGGLLYDENTDSFNLGKYGSNRVIFLQRWGN
jgi:hypothetical protein